MDNIVIKNASISIDYRRVLKELINECVQVKKVLKRDSLGQVFKIVITALACVIAGVFFYGRDLHYAEVCGCVVLVGFGVFFVCSIIFDPMGFIPKRWSTLFECEVPEVIRILEDVDIDNISIKDAYSILAGLYADHELLPCQNFDIAYMYNTGSCITSLLDDTVIICGEKDSMYSKAVERTCSVRVPNPERVIIYEDSILCTCSCDAGNVTDVVDVSIGV